MHARHLIVQFNGKHAPFGDIYPFSFLLIGDS